MASIKKTITKTTQRVKIKTVTQCENCGKWAKGKKKKK